MRPAFESCLRGAAPADKTQRRSASRYKYEGVEEDWDLNGFPLLPGDSPLCRRLIQCAGDYVCWRPEGSLADDTCVGVVSGVVLSQGKQVVGLLACWNSRAS